MMKKVLLSLSLLLINLDLSASSQADLKEKCLKNDAKACYELGFPLTQGDNAKVQDYLEEGMAYMRKACRYGENRACDVLGARYFKDKSYMIATKYLSKSCDRGIKTACESLGVIYRDGHLKKFDDVKAREFFDKACTLHSGSACFNVAIIYRAGLGVQKSRSQEKVFYKKACDENLTVGCERFTELDNEDKGIETGFLATIKHWFK